MQIQLRQSELVQAVRQFITHQGINLDGKSVDVDFTAGRGDNGMTATINIEQAPRLPDLSDAPSDPQLRVVASNNIKVGDTVTVDKEPAVSEDKQEDPPTSAKTSLFAAGN
jgi:hypothetical protein